MKVRYNLGEHGWGDVSLREGMREVSMTISYLHDTLFEFITAANLLLKGAPEAKVILMDEPGEHIIHLHATDATSVDIEVRWFRDWASWNMISEKEYKVVFSCRTTILNFATEVFNAAKKMLDDYGVDGYKERWIEYDFPRTEYLRLKTLLKK